MANTTHRPVTEAIEYPDCDGRPIGEDTLHFDWIVRIEQWLEFIEERRRSNDLQSLARRNTPVGESSSPQGCGNSVRTTIDGCHCAARAPPSGRPFMRLGYNTNGLAHHRLTDAIDLLADEGYRSIAITLDAGALDPYQDAASLAREVDSVRAALDRAGLARVIETGGALPLEPPPQARPDADGPGPRAAPSASTFCFAPSTWPDLSRLRQSRSGQGSPEFRSPTTPAWSGSPQP